MKEKMKEIAQRVSELRELSEIGIEDMANQLDVPVETYMGYEEGKNDISASVLYEIAQKLNVDMGLLLTGEETRMHIFAVTRKGKGVRAERRKEYKYENLAEKFIHKKAEPFIVSVKPRTELGKPLTNTHPGQEFNYVIKGTLKIYIHDNEIVLEEGDSIFFDSSYEHAMEALNDKKAKFLAIIL